MKTAMLLFPGFTALDAIGPYHALASLPGWDFTFVAERPGPVSNGGSFTMIAPVGIDEIGQPDASFPYVTYKGRDAAALVADLIATDTNREPYDPGPATPLRVAA